MTAKRKPFEGFTPKGRTRRGGYQPTTGKAGAPPRGGTAVVTPPPVPFALPPLPPGMAGLLDTAPMPATWPAPTFDDDMMRKLQAAYVVIDRWRCEGLEKLGRELWRRLDRSGHRVQGETLRRRKIKACTCELCALVRKVFELEEVKP